MTKISTHKAKNVWIPPAIYQDFKDSVEGTYFNEVVASLIASYNENRIVIDENLSSEPLKNYPPKAIYVPGHLWSCFRKITFVRGLDTNRVLAELLRQYARKSQIVDLSKS